MSSCLSCWEHFHKSLHNIWPPIIQSSPTESFITHCSQWVIEYLTCEAFIRKIAYCLTLHFSFGNLIYSVLFMSQSHSLHTGFCLFTLQCFSPRSGTIQRAPSHLCWRLFKLCISFPVFVTFVASTSLNTPAVADVFSALTYASAPLSRDLPHVLHFLITPLFDLGLCC